MKARELGAFQTRRKLNNEETHSNCRHIHLGGGRGESAGPSKSRSSALQSAVGQRVCAHLRCPPEAGRQKSGALASAPCRLLADSQHAQVHVLGWKNENGNNQTGSSGLA